MSDEQSLDQLLSDETPEIEIEAETPEVEEPAEVAEQPEPEKAPEPEQPEKQPEPQQQMVPLAALQQEREKTRSINERLAQLEAHLTQRQQAKLPDMFEQPEAYQQAMQRMLAEREANIVAEMSERFARTQHGDDVVDAAFEAAQAAGVVDQFRGRRDAWGDLVKWHKSQKVISEIGDDPDAWRARERERIRQELQAELTAESVKQAAAKAAPSLAGQSNLGSRQAPAWGGPTPLDDILKG